MRISFCDMWKNDFVVDYFFVEFLYTLQKKFLRECLFLPGILPDVSVWKNVCEHAGFRVIFCWCERWSFFFSTASVISTYASVCVS